VHQKAVELRLGQRIRAFLLDGILRGHDQKQIRQPVGLAPDRYLPFPHGLEQGRLHLRRRPIDLVGEHQIVEQRTLLEHERAVLRTIDLGAGQIGGQQIGGELNTMEITLDALAQHLDRARLGQTGGAFDQQMPVREQRDQQAVHETVLPDDALGDERLQGRDGILGRHVDACCIRSFSGNASVARIVMA
jgi:hypothetical protein